MNFAQPFQDYEILDRLGAGAMGTVFKARHKKLGRIVALKVLKPSLARDERYVDRLRREARIVASLNHPNVVAGYDLGEEGGYHFFVMELAEGKSLRSLLAEWGMFAEQQVLSVGTQVAAALDHAFQRGVIHRDVKPGNILIDEKGNVKLTDMGLAKGPTDLTLTKDGATVGTPQYISPEQARNPQEVDIRSDLYSLGATLYHMATGQPPFRAETLAELITKVLSETVRSPQELNPELSAGLSLVIRKLLAKDLTVRYQTPRELLDDLERVGRNEAPVVDAGSLDQGERAPARRSFLRGALAVGLLLAVLAVGAWVGSQVRGHGNGDAPVDLVFQQRLDQQLAEIPTMGERWVHLKMVGATAPASASAFLREREAQVLAKMQLALDDAVQSFIVERRAEVDAWLSDPNSWPSADDFAQRKLGPMLHATVGLPREQLPKQIDRSGLDELDKLVGEQIARRDEGLLGELDSYAKGPLASEVQELLRRSQDFAAAQKRWDGGLQAFGDSKAPGLLVRIPKTLLQELRARYTVVKDAGLAQVERSEQEAAADLQGDVEEGLALLQEGQRGGAPWRALSIGLASLRSGLIRRHPPSSCFRLESNPWPQVEQQLQTYEQKVDLLQTQAEIMRLDWYLEMAYRTLCAGGFAEASELLRIVTIEEPEAQRVLQRHRQAIEAADQVAASILAWLERSGEPHGFWRADAGRPVPLRVQRNGDQLRLYVELPGAPAREAMLTEFLLPDLIQRAGRGGAFRDLAGDQRARGELVLGMAADDLSGLPGRLRDAGDQFLLDEVWPRIRRLRGEPRELAGPNRRESWLRVVQAWHRAQADKVLQPLQEALMAFEGRVPDADLSPEDRQELKRVKGWLSGERARQDLEAALRNENPNAKVEVVRNEASLESSVRLGPTALRSLAGEGWSAVDQPAQMVHTTPAPIEEWNKKRLELTSGMAAAGRWSACTAVLWLPPVEGDRIWVLEFHGVAFLLAMAQDGSVGAAFLGADEVQSREALQRSVRRAFAPFLGTPKMPRAVPGGLHRIGVEVERVAGRRDTVRVLFEGTELVSEQRKVDSRSAPVLRIYPTQVVGVTAVEFRGRTP